MPIHLPPLSRRRFLLGALAGAGGAAAGAGWWWFGDRTPPPVDPNRLALLSDTHLHADRGYVHATNVNVWDHFRRAAKEVLALDTRPAAALINGDVAFKNGAAGEYVTVVEALKPLREAGIPIHCALGNHDHRDNFLAALPQDERRVNDVADKCVSVLRQPHADWYLLDTLDQTDVTPGRVGAQQLDWLANRLDGDGARPAVIMLHHQPDQREPSEHNGLIDTASLLDVVKPRKQVKALLHGHLHGWNHRDDEGLHVISLPATAYVFDDRHPSGWVDARTSPAGMTLQLRSLTPDHWADKQRIELAWR